MAALWIVIAIVVLLSAAVPVGAVLGLLGFGIDEIFMSFRYPARSEHAC